MDQVRGIQMRPWQKPELVVLVRHRAEEAVLSTCKVAGAGNFPTSALVDCMEMPCAPCNAVGAS